jgi:N-acyl amino acid synthase of PEP-CTERM/exosortase system
MRERKKRIKLYFCSTKTRELSKSDSFVKEEGGFIRNISESGACISTSDPIVASDVVSLYFRLPSVQHNFFLKARAVWTKKEEVGLAFIEASEEDRLHIREYFENCEKDSMYKHYQQLLDKFNYMAADSEDMQKEIFRLRYLIYVKEKSWEPINNSGVETDEYDGGSAHFMVKDKNDVVVAATRMMPADKFQLPIEKHFDVDVTLGGAVPRTEIVEVSRLCIAKEYRRRVEDIRYNPHASPENAASAATDIHSRSPNLLLGLYREMIHYSHYHGITYWFMVIENHLANSIIKNTGWKLFKVGEPRSFHGLRTPYYTKKSYADLEAEMRDNPMLFQWFVTGLKGVGNAK